MIFALIILMFAGGFAFGFEVGRGFERDIKLQERLKRGVWKDPKDGVEVTYPED